MHQNRRHADRQEMLLSLGILALLGVIAAGIFATQYRFNPVVLQMQNASRMSDTGQQTPGSQAGEPIIAIPEGMTVMTPPETFAAGNLSDKINGKADLYLSTGFVRLQSQRFRNEKVSGEWLEVFVYDMGSAENAFSVFSVQRREDAEALPIAAHAYRTENALFLVHGPFYVEIVASLASDEMSRSLGLLAETFIARTPTENPAMAEQTLFPPAGLLKNSIAMIANDAFGFERLDRVFSASYDLGGTQLTAFFSRRNAAREAEALAQDYAGFLTDFGGQTLESDLSIPGAAAIEILDTFEIVFSHGPYFAGVRDATDFDQAKALCLRLYDRLKEH